MTDRFGNQVYVPIEADIADTVTMKDFNVQAVADTGNSNETTLSISGNVGVLSSTGTFTPLAGNEIYLYYDKDINYPNLPITGGKKSDCTALPVASPSPDNGQAAANCAFNVQDSSNPTPPTCVQSNPVYTTQEDFRCPDSEQVTYAPQYNSGGTCNPPANGLLMPQYFQCNVYGKTGGDSMLTSTCPNTGVLQTCGSQSSCGNFASINDCLLSGNAQSNLTDSQGYCETLCTGSYSSFLSCLSGNAHGSGSEQYCVPTDSFSGNGICTSQLGLIANVVTDDSGHFSANGIVACGSGQALIKADFYGYPAPEPIQVLQIPLSFTANEVNGNCLETSTTITNLGGLGGALGSLIGAALGATINTGCLADAVALGPQAELNYSYAPSDASKVLQIGLVELSFGGIGDIEVAAGVALALLLMFHSRIGAHGTKGKKRERFNRKRAKI